MAIPRDPLSRPPLGRMPSPAPVGPPAGPFGGGPPGFEGSWDPRGAQGQRTDTSGLAGPQPQMPEGLDYMGRMQWRRRFDPAYRTPYDDFVDWRKHQRGLVGDDWGPLDIARSARVIQEKEAALAALYGDDWARWSGAAQRGRQPHQGFPGQSGGTPYIRPDTGASQANMIQAMKAQQMRDSAAANRQARGDEQFKRQQWEQLMQMMQMLIGGGGGNQVTPPSMGGFNSGQYNMRPPAGEIL